MTELSVLVRWRWQRDGRPKWDVEQTIRESELADQELIWSGPSMGEPQRRSGGTRERAGRWQRRLATLIFADRARMRVVRRRPPLTSCAASARPAGRIVPPRIPPCDALARSLMPPDH